MTNNKQQTGINEVEYIIKVNQFAKENNTDKPKQQTAVEWFWNQLPEILPFTVDTETAVKLQEAYQQAQEMHRQQAINLYYEYERYVMMNQSDEMIIMTFGQFYKQTYGKE